MVGEVTRPVESSAYTLQIRKIALVAEVIRGKSTDGEWCEVERGEEYCRGGDERAVADEHYCWWATGRRLIN